jgi:hypothetical protein
MSEIVAGGTAADRGRPDVGALLESVRRAEGRLGRRRGEPAGLSETERSAMRFLAEAGRSTEVTNTMLVAALHLAAASGTALIERLLARGLVVVDVSSQDRRKKVIRLVDDSMNPDEFDPLTATLRAIAARLTLSDARVVAGFLEEVLATLDSTGRPPLPTTVH